jgi:16S rRNA (adenine1518-N6/adenine1519-N6)-dimethyltransferase
MKKLPPNKELGQHFLKDKSIIESIVTDHKDLYDIIIEVGPGKGALTEPLAKLKKPLYLIEFDDRFYEHLSQWVPTENIFIADALKFDFKEITLKHPGKNIWLVSNLPYNISAPLFVKFSELTSITFMTLMYQKEVGEKTYLKQNSKNQMNSLLALSLNTWESKLLAKVKPGAFNPPPKVDSVVISYQRKNKPMIKVTEWDSYHLFIRELFNLKRKQIIQMFKEENLENFPVNPKLRAEALEIEEVLKLYDFYKKTKR